MKGVAPSVAFTCTTPPGKYARSMRGVRGNDPAMSALTRTKLSLSGATRNCKGVVGSTLTRWNYGRRGRADHLASLLGLQRPIQLPLGPVCIVTPNDREESISVNTAAVGDRLQSLPNRH